jgi:hypothetical protein
VENKLAQPNLRHYPDIGLDVKRKTMKNSPCIVGAPADFRNDISTNKPEELPIAVTFPLLGIRFKHNGNYNYHLI